MVNPLQVCAYFNRGDACKYCVLSLAMDAGARMKLMQPVPDPATLAEAVVLAKQDIELRDLKICGGALYDTRKEARYCKDCLAAILERTEPPEEIQIFSQAFDEPDQRDLKAMGATNVLFNLEVWNPRLIGRTAPG